MSSSQRRLPASLHWASILLAVCVVSMASGQARAQTLAQTLDKTLVITGATIIDGTGKAPLRDGVVLIADGRIAAVGSSRDVTIPKAAKKLDGRGKYVIPGLMEAVNLAWFSTDVENLVKYEGRYHELFIEAAQVALKSGITGAFATWRSHAPVMKARDMIKAGGAPGSAIYVGGNIIGFDGMFSPDSYDGVGRFVSSDFIQRTNEEFVQGTGRELMWMTPEEVRTIVRRYIQTHKLDYLKYAASGHFMQGGHLNAQFLVFSPRVQKAIVEEGHRAGLSVQVHTMSPESIEMAIEAGADMLTHGDMSGLREIPQETLVKLRERGIAVGVLPITQRNLDGRLKVLRPDSTTFAKETTTFIRISKTNRRNMIKAGVMMLAGTESSVKTPAEATSIDDTVDDPSLHSQLGDAHFNALLALEEEGMDRMEILKSATSNVAKAYKLDATVGTLERGKVANLVILDANPLESARNYRSISVVIKDGKVVDRGTLPLSPIITAAGPGSR